MKRIAFAAVFACTALPAAAQAAVSANDNKQVNIAGVGIGTAR